MCGIAGVVFGECAEEQTRKALHAVSYRGSIWGGVRQPDYSFYAVRLPRSGQRNRPQPVISPQGNILVFNGEIYNVNDLADALDIKPQLDSIDTEIVAMWLDKFGVGGVSRLDGEFALAWYDVGTQQLYLARDAHGTHPLYFLKNGNRIGFGSSPKASSLLGGREPSIDLDAATELLWYGVSTGGTAISGVNRVAPGCVMRFARFGEPTCERVLSFADPSKSLVTRLAKAVKSRITADGKSFLAFSGGIDSGLVAANWPTGNCAKYRVSSRQAPDRPGLTNVCATPSKLFAALETMSNWAERPITSLSGPAFHILCKDAALNGHEVRLGGEGADEIFWGYSHYFLQSRGHPFLRAKQRLKSVVSDLLHLYSACGESQGLSRYLRSGSPRTWNHFDRTIRLPEHLNFLNNDLPSLLAGIESRCPYLALADSFSPRLEETPKASLYKLARTLNVVAPKKKAVFFGCRQLSRRTIEAMADESQNNSICSPPRRLVDRVTDVLNKCSSLPLGAAAQVEEAVCAYVVGLWTGNRVMTHQGQLDFLPSRCTRVQISGNRMYTATLEGDLRHPNDQIALGSLSDVPLGQDPAATSRLISHGRFVSENR